MVAHHSTIYSKVGENLNKQTKNVSKKWKLGRFLHTFEEQERFIVKRFKILIQIFFLLLQNSMAQMFYVVCVATKHPASITAFIRARAARWVNSFPLFISFSPLLFFHFHKMCYSKSTNELKLSHLDCREIFLLKKTWQMLHSFSFLQSRHWP